MVTLALTELTIIYLYGILAGGEVGTKRINYYIYMGF